MKKIPQCMRVLVVLVLIFAFQQANAQFYYASNADNLTGVGTSTQPPNTGTDVEPGTSGPLQVMVWDGSSPTLAWDDNGTLGSQAILGTSSGTVSDPDVVADPSGSGDVFITYALTVGTATRIYYEVINITSGVATTVTSPTVLSGSAQSPCSNPNVDVSSTGSIVVVYQYNPAIAPQVYAKATTFSSISFVTGNGFNVFGSGSLSLPKTVPDVAIEANDALVNFVFITNDGTNKNLLLRQASLSNVTLGSGSPSASYTLDAIPVANTMGRPRIAANWYTGTGSNTSDCHVVVQENDDIVGFTHDASAYGAGMYQKIVINTDYSLNSCGNIDPATSYVGDYIIDTWTYQDAVCGNLAGDDDVLARQLTWNGATHNPDYSVLGNSLFGNQNASSIAGRFMSVVNAYGYYLWWDEAYPDMLYKSDYYTNTSLKTGLAEAPKAEDTFKVYPNPFHDQVRVDFNIADGETAQQIEVFDIAGKKILSKDISGLGMGTNNLQLNTNGWVSGVYFVRLSTSQQVQTARLIKE